MLIAAWIYYAGLVWFVVAWNQTSVWTIIAGLSVIVFGLAILGFYREKLWCLKAFLLSLLGHYIFIVLDLEVQGEINAENGQVYFSDYIFVIVVFLAPLLLYYLVRSFLHGQTTKL